MFFYYCNICNWEGEPGELQDRDSDEGNFAYCPVCRGSCLTEEEEDEEDEEKT